jgi:hypothetical protein
MKKAIKKAAALIGTGFADLPFLGSVSKKRGV